MRRTISAVVGAAAVSVPAGQAWAEAASVPSVVPKKTVVTRTVAGPAVEADRWGDVRVTIVVRITTTTVGTKKTVARKLTRVSATYPSDGRSLLINKRAIPVLCREALTAQSARVDLVSGATHTSEAFVDSLQAAIAKARKLS